MPSLPRRSLLATVAVIVVALLAVAAGTVFRVHRALSRSAESIRAAHHMPFTLRPLDPAALRAANPGFEPVAARVPYTAGAILAGELYLSSPAGLHLLESSGEQRLLLRSGIELPAAQLGQVTTGRLRGAPGPQVLVASAGAGVLILTPNPGGAPAIAQLKPADPELADVTAVLATPAGDLLLGTRHRGLQLFNGDTLAPAPLTLPGLDAARLEITALAPAGADGSATLIGTRSAGVLYQSAGVTEQIGSAAGLPDDQVASLLSAAGRAWVGTPGGVAEIELASPAHPVRTVAPRIFAQTLSFAGGTLYAGTLDQGIQTISLAPRARLRNASITAPSDASAAEAAEPVAGLPLDHATGTLYALAGMTILRRTGGVWSPAFGAATPAQSLTDGNISALAFAPDGRLWVGFFDRGLDQLNPDLTRAAHLEDDHLFCLNRLAVDPAHGTLAAATANGLVLFDAAGHPRQTLTRRDGLISDHINDLLYSSNGGLTVATPAGITFLDAGAPSSLYAFQGLVNNHVYALAASAADPRVLVAGTLGGLSLLRSETVERSLTAGNSALRHNWITAILALKGPEPGAQPTWLIGTYGAGLERMTISPGGAVSFTKVELPSGAARNVVINSNALFATPAALYAGTLDHGVLVCPRRTGRWSVVTAGLPSRNVTAFAVRGQGSTAELFVGTAAGLLHISEPRLLASLGVSGGAGQ